MKRFTKMTIAALFAVSSIAQAADPTTNTATNNVSVSPQERAKIEEVVHQYLLQKPEVLIESLQNFQKKQYEQAEKTVKQTQVDAPQYNQALFHNGNDPVAGNPNGKITVVEFFDYQCAHCSDMRPTMDAVIKANPDLRVVYKDWPIRGPVSEFAARAALAANKQGKYTVFNHAIFKAPQPLTEDKILQIAKTVGLDVKKLQQDMNDTSIQDQVKATMKLAQDLKLFGTPAFFFAPTNAKDGTAVTYIPGQMNQTQMQEVIKKVSTQ